MYLCNKEEKRIYNTLNKKEIPLLQTPLQIRYNNSRPNFCIILKSELFACYKLENPPSNTLVTTAIYLILRSYLCNFTEL